MFCLLVRCNQLVEARILFLVIRHQTRKTSDNEIHCPVALFVGHQDVLSTRGEPIIASMVFPGKMLVLSNFHLALCNKEFAPIRTVCSSISCSVRSAKSKARRPSSPETRGRS